MAVIYAAAIGHDNIAGLLPLDPQPRNGEVMATARTYSDGGARDVGLYSRPLWDMVADDPQFQSILTQFGILDADECDITWQTRDHAFRVRTYNGRAIKPKPVEDGGLKDYFIREQSILIINLVEIEV